MYFQGTAHEWQEFLGEQVKAMRLRKNMTQREMASRCDVSMPTISHLENGHDVSLLTFIKVIQVLGEEAWFRQLQPPVVVSPIQRAEEMKRRRRRARG